jgi:hypothetical protein
MVFDSQGRLFWSNLYDPGTGDVELYVAQVILNTNGAAPTLQFAAGSPFLVDNTGQSGSIGDDKEFLAVDANDNLIISWSQAASPWNVLISRSTDQGQHWSTPITVSSTSEGTVWPTSVAVAPNGEVFVAYHSTPNRDNTKGQVFLAGYSNDLGQQLVKTNVFGAGGAKQLANYPDLQGLPSPGFQGSAGPWVLADPTRPGNVYVFSIDYNTIGPGGLDNIIFGRSTDYGQHFLKQAIGFGPSSTNWQIFPTAAIDQFGDIVVAWYDNRNGGTSASTTDTSNTLMDVYAKYSTDGGQSWGSTQSFQVNDPINRFDDVVQSSGNLVTSRMPDYFGINVFGGTAYVAWAGNTWSSGGYPTAGSTVTGQQTWMDTFALNGSITVNGSDNDTITLQNIPGNASFFEVLESNQTAPVYAGLWSSLTGGTNRIYTRQGSSTIRILNLPAGVNLQVFTSTGTDRVVIGNATNNLSGILGAITVNGNGSTTLEVNDAGNGTTPAQFAGYTPISTTFTIDAGQITRSAVANVSLQILPLPIPPTPIPNYPFTTTVAYSSLADLTVDGGPVVQVTPTPYRILNTTQANAVVIQATGSDAITLGDASHDLSGISSVTVAGNGSTTLKVNDAGNAMPPAQFAAYMPVSTTFTIDAGQLTRSAVANVSLQVLPLPIPPTPIPNDQITTTIGYSGLASLTVDGGPAVPVTPTPYDILNTSQVTALIVKAHGSDAVMLGDASHNLSGLSSVTVTGNGSTTLEVNDASNATTPAQFAAYMPLSTTFTIDAGQLTRSAAANVSLQVLPLPIPPTPIPNDQITTTIGYSGLASLTVDGGPAVPVTPTPYRVLSTLGTNSVIINAHGADAVSLGDASHNLSGISSVNVVGNGATTVEVNDASNAMLPAGLFSSYTPISTSFAIDATQLTRSAQALVTLPNQSFPTQFPFPTTVTYGGVASLTVDGGPAVLVTPTPYRVLSTLGTNSVIINAHGADAASLGDASHNLSGISSVNVVGNGATTVEVNDAGNAMLPAGLFSSYTPISTSFAIDATQLTRSAQALVTLPSQSFPIQFPFTTTVAYGGLASLTVDGGPAVAFMPTTYQIHNTAGIISPPGTSAVTINAHGSDAVTIADANNTINGIQGAVTVSGNGATSLNAIDTGTGSAQIYQLFGTRFLRYPVPPPGQPLGNPTQTINYFNIGHFHVHGATSAATWYANNTLAGTTTDLISGNGLPAGLVSLWRGDGNANDFLGRNNGTLPTSGVSFAQGVSGATGDQALSFNGSNALVDVGHDPSLNISGNLTVSAWVNVQSLGHAKYLFADFDPTGHLSRGSLGILSNGHFFWFQGNEGLANGFVEPFGATQVNLNQWYNVAVVRDDNAKTITLYVNGVQDGMVSYAGIPVLALQGDELLGGGGTGFPRDSLNGLLDEVGLFNRALSAAEIQSIYNSRGSSIGGSVNNQNEFIVKGPSGGLDGIQGPLALHGGGVEDFAIVDDSVNNTGGHTYTLTAGRLQRDGMADITYDGMGTVSILGGPADKTFSIQGFNNAPSIILVAEPAGSTRPNQHNKLDYSQYTGPVQVNLPLGTATGFAHISGIQDVTGGNGNNLLVGDANPNILIGGTGRNIIIGGGGGDTLDASRSQGDNILIGGRTNWDQSVAALDAIMMEWLSGLSFQQRLSLIQNGGDPNDPYLLNNTTVFDDGAVDVMTGGAGRNWFFAQRRSDMITNFKTGSDHTTPI